MGKYYRKLRRSHLRSEIHKVNARADDPYSESDSDDAEDEKGVDETGDFLGGEVAEWDVVEAQHMSSKRGICH